jgi:methylglyoxal synthase
MRALILLAHQSKGKQLAKLLNKHSAVFEEFRLISTSETGEMLEEKTGLEVSHIFPARKGGDIQLCGLVCTNSIAAVIFLNDPLEMDPAQPDIAQFLRACDINNVPLATNVVSAHALVLWLGRNFERVPAGDAGDRGRGSAADLPPGEVVQ